MFHAGCFVLGAGHTACFVRRILEQISTRVTADSLSEEGGALLNFGCCQSVVRLILFLYLRGRSAFTTSESVIFCTWQVWSRTLVGEGDVELVFEALVVLDGY